MNAINLYKQIINGTLKRFPAHFWDGKTGQINAVILTRYLIENILRWNTEDIKKNLCTTTFFSNKLRGMLKIVYNGSPYRAINTAYPNRIYPWQLCMCPLKFWNENNGIKATKWLIEEKLRWNDEQIMQGWNRKILIDNGLKGLLTTVYNDSPYEAINMAYPNRFKPWEFRKVKQSYWNLENGIIATRWLIEEKMRCSSDEDIISKLRYHTFKKYGLENMLITVFDSSPYMAIDATYPNRFNKQQFRTRENKIRVTK